MELPIDLRKAPFKPKYVDEETPMFARWFVFGHHVDDGTVWITDGTVDVLEGVPRDKAERIVTLRNAWCDAMMEEINAATPP